MASFNVVRRDFLLPEGFDPATPVELDLTGVDRMFNGMNVRFVYFFNDILPAEALRKSLGKVRGYSDSIP
jgi:hypothetical protein